MKQSQIRAMMAKRNYVVHSEINGKKRTDTVSAHDENDAHRLFVKKHNIKHDKDAFFNIVRAKA